MSRLSSMSFVYLSKCHPVTMGLSHENFRPFHPLLPLQKATFVFCLAWPPPSRWPSFEHCSTKMDILDIDPVYSTLCPSITLTRSTSKFHLNMLQYSVSGLAMLDAFTYGNDCITILRGRTVHQHSGDPLLPVEPADIDLHWAMPVCSRSHPECKFSFRF